MALYYADCIDVLRTLPDGSVDMILQDPPYGVTACEWDITVHLPTMWPEWERVLKMDGVLAFTAAQPFTTDLINSNRAMFRYCWYWIKNRGTNFFNAGKMPIRKVEEVVIFYRKQPTYNPQITVGHKPTHSARGCSNGRVYHGSNKRDYKGGSTTRLPTNVLEIACVNNNARIHPTEKPVDLFRYLIRTYTNEGEAVFDGYAGSGTTAVACIRENRKYILCEADTIWVDAAKKRIRREKRLCCLKERKL